MIIWPFSERETFKQRQAAAEFRKANLKWRGGDFLLNGFDLN